eukprot:6176638-Pleurochrysis_carterae.AAC.3
MPVENLELEASNSASVSSVHSLVEKRRRSVAHALLCRKHAKGVGFLIAQSHEARTRKALIKNGWL